MKAWFALGFRNAPFGYFPQGLINHFTGDVWKSSFKILHRCVHQVIEQGLNRHPCSPKNRVSAVDVRVNHDDAFLGFRRCQ